MAQQWIRRRGGRPGHFRYVTESGAPVSAARAAQIDALAVPSAWTDVHIAASPSAPIQAWGYDARGRKQYRYHPRAAQKGALRKYYRVRQMARDLPRIRRRVYDDFRSDGASGLSRERVLAGILRLIADGCFRVGNDRYAKENHTFGITTLRKSHARVAGDAITFHYVGKRSIRHRHTIVNAELARFVAELLRTPGLRLFRYREGERWVDVTSRHVNDYLQAVAHFPYTAKDFRTWGGTLRAATVLAELGAAASEREVKRNVTTAIRVVAAELGNTPAVCRDAYVHPVVLEKYLQDGVTIRCRPTGGRSSRATPWTHTPEERALVSFLDVHFPERRRRRREV